LDHSKNTKIVPHTHIKERHTRPLEERAVMWHDNLWS